MSIMKTILSAGCDKNIKNDVSVFVCESICVLILLIEK